MKGDFAYFLLSHAAYAIMLFFVEKSQVSLTGEPTEKALVLAAYHAGANKPELDKVCATKRSWRKMPWRK